MAVTQVAKINDAVLGGAIEVIQATAVNPGAITAGSTEDQTVTHTGITSSDRVIAVVPIVKDTTTALLTVGAAVCTTDTITVTLGNASAGSLNGGAVTLMITVLKAAA
jgi:hypothetical protein